MKKKKAFTLAEVLITLTIIGVIVAITIPNLMQSWRKHERITQIKEAYSIIQNATRMAVAEHGNPDGWDFNGYLNYAQKYFVPYIKIQKVCGSGTAKSDFKESGCFKKSGRSEDNGTWSTLAGRDYEMSGYGAYSYYTMIFQNGMHLGIWAPVKNNQGAQRNIIFLVDVDGKQGPTTLGKDIFIFRYNLDTGKFMTGGDSGDYSDCTLTGAGTACAYWIERNHWEFPDDYPVKKF